MKNLLSKIVIIVVLNNQIFASQKPYVPSYDDWYTGDLLIAKKNKNYFKEPADELNYAQYHYIGAHFAERYPRFFSESYVSQEQSIPGMLYAGTRGLMLTVWNWNLAWSSILTEGRSIVCSHPHVEPGILTKDGRRLYQTLHYEMNRVFNFLKEHPKAVITILFNDQCDIPKLVRDLQEIVSKNNYNPILKPSDWKVDSEKKEWPTLGWMRKNNKRLVLFTQNHRVETEFTRPLESYIWENNTGTTDLKLVCLEEKETEITKAEKNNRSLVSFGCYGGTAINQARNNYLCFEYDFVKKLTTSCQKKNFAKGKKFNGYWVDHVIYSADTLSKRHIKTAFDYINELNDAAVHK
jgi:hypothetical protein